MKRIFAFALFLTMLLGLSQYARAYTLSLQWQTPGSVRIASGITDNFVDIPEGATSMDVDCEKSWDAIYVYSTPGYILEKGECDGQEIAVTKSGDTEFLRLTSAQVGNPVIITCTKPKATDEITIDIVNGANITKVTNNTGATYTLEKGENTIGFNPELDNPLIVEIDGVTEAKSIEVNGEAYNPDPDSEGFEDQPIKKWSTMAAVYHVTLQGGDVLTIQPLETGAAELVECKVTFTYADDMAGCIDNIYNRTNSHTFYNYNFDNKIINEIEVVQGSEIRVNFTNPDYQITSVTLNGTSVTGNLETNSDGTKSLIVTINDANTTINIQGSMTQWTDIVYTGYVSNPEAVEFGLNMAEDYTLNYTEVGDCGGQTFGVLTMPAGSKKIEITVSQKNNNGHGTFYFKPKDGYFFDKCYVGTPNDSDSEKGTLYSNEAIGMDDDHNFYMILTEMDPAYTAELNVVGYSSTVYMKGSSIGRNGNPEGKKISIVANGETEISFIPNYDNPFTIALAQDQTAKIYLDGAEVSGAANSDANTTDYTLELYAPAKGETSDAHSKVDVYFSGSPSMATAKLVLENNATAEFYYSPVKRLAQDTQSVIAGTVMTVKPTSANAVVLYKGVAQTLDTNGEFQFTTSTTDADNSVTVTGPKSAKLEGMIPVNGSSVKSFNQVDLILPALETEANQWGPNMEILNQTVVQFNNENVAEISELGEPYANAEGKLVIPIIFNKTLTADGRYYIKIPQGAFEETAWNQSQQEYAPVPGGFINAAVNYNLKVDSSLGSVFDNYTLSPADGEKVGEIAQISLVFNQLPANASLSSWKFENATLSNGEKTVEAIVELDWNYEEDNLAFNIKPVNEDEEATPITEAGTWTLKIAAGTFANNDGEANSDITATYTIGDQVAAYVISPENGAKVDALSEISITFNGVETVEYNDIAIKLEGPDDFIATSTDVTGTDATRTVSFRNPGIEGEYTVTFPAGAFTLDGEASVEAVASFILKNKWAISPAAGSTVTSLDEITLTFPDATEVEFVGANYMFSLAKGQAWSAPGMECEKVEGTDVPTFKLTNYDDVTIPNGNLIFSVEEGAFEIDGVPSPEIQVAYTMNAPVTNDYQVSPEGTIVIQEYGIDFAFLFDERTNITTPAKADVTVTIDDEPIAFEMMVESNMLMFGIYQAELPEGTLKVTIPAGAFKIGKEESPAISQEWNLVAAKVFEPEISFAGEAEGNSVSDLGKIYITFPDATSGEVWNPYGSFASLKKNDYSYFQNGTVELVENETRATGVTFSITFDPAPTEDGDYTLAVREGTFILDGVYSSPEIDHIFMLDSTMTGIESIFADENGNVTVYTLDGRVILNNVPAAQLRELEKGMYIINGKKTLVK